MTSAANILIIEPSTSGLKLLVAAKQLGITVFVFSACCDERIIPKEYQVYINKLIEVDTNNYQAMFAAAKALHAEVSLAAVVPGFEIFVLLSHQLARALGLPANSLETANCLRNKLFARNKLVKQGIRSVRYQSINSSNELEKAAKYVGFPAVLKPVDQSGSVHVTKVNSMQELATAYQTMCADHWTEMGKGVGSEALLEQYIAGKEYSVEGVVEDGQPFIYAITEKQLSPEPYFVELGHVVPAKITTAEEDLLVSYTTQVINALAVQVGSFHCELRVDENGPVLIEIAGRLAGDRICDLVKLAFDQDLYQYTLSSYLGNKLPAKSQTANKQAGICFFALANEVKTFANVEGVEQIKLIPGFIEYIQFYQAGDSVPPLTAFYGRVAAVIFCCETSQQLQQAFSQARQTLRFI